jgi:hypothetical protein
MNLILQRFPSADGATIGEITIDGIHECWTCEDVVRPLGEKVPGQTAIPSGRYRVIVNRSKRFSELAGHDVFLPLLLEVPGFDGVRMHTGNRPEDTEGCILPGQVRLANSVLTSLLAFDRLFAKICAAVQDGGQCWIDVRDA